MGSAMTQEMSALLHIPTRNPSQSFNYNQNYCKKMCLSESIDEHGRPKLNKVTINITAFIWLLEKH